MTLTVDLPLKALSAIAVFRVDRDLYLRLEEQLSYQMGLLWREGRLSCEAIVAP